MFVVCMLVIMQVDSETKQCGVLTKSLDTRVSATGYKHPRVYTTFYAIFRDDSGIETVREVNADQFYLGLGKRYCWVVERSKSVFFAWLFFSLYLAWIFIESVKRYFTDPAS